jgi:hypothetical protein
MAAHRAATAERRTRGAGSITKCVWGQRCPSLHPPCRQEPELLDDGSTEEQGRYCHRTGAGIGAAIARAFADEGARVVVSDIDVAAAEEVAASIAGAIAITADVADETQVENLVARTVSTFGQLNVVVPNVRAVVSDMST